jgi:hypothetical protein
MDVPKEILCKIILTEKNGLTTLHLHSEPFNASESEYKTFASIFEGMKQGFDGTFNQLDQYLKTLSGDVIAIKSTY